MSNMSKTRNKNYIKKNGSLADNYPHVAAEWHPIKNAELTPHDVLAGSNQKVWWKGKCDHEWQATIASRTKIGAGCPICSGRQILPGYNDLATTNPKLLEEWDFEKNTLNPTKTSPNSHEKAWWRCKNGHSWEAQIRSRNRGCGCPYCSNNKVLKGYNDLQSVNPILANEWNYEKNGTIRPEEFLASSEKKVWWLCPDCGYEWQASIYHRNKGSGCPECAKQNRKKKGT